MPTAHDVLHLAEATPGNFQERRKTKKTDFQKIISTNPTVDDVSRVTQVSGSSIDDLAVWLSWDSPSCVKPFLREGGGL